ncbi:MAG TPA: NAD-dependent epimerase/dehydratase family protein [Kiritimatiellia bacterium]|nr:NAD-dependent epimerase/dehydratase family protein [Kiritimatiellia bacterium]
MNRLLGDSIQRVYLTGGAGFIGSHIVDRLLADGYHVTVVDNLSNGRREFVEPHFGNHAFKFIEADLMNDSLVRESMKGHDLVWHLAANTDIIGSHAKPRRDLNDCAIVTFNVLDAMRENGIQPILFASTGAVYGELCVDNPVTEDAGPLLPISTYAAGKIASEAFISSFSQLYGVRGWMFRFGNVVGGRMTHGVIYDFINRLRANPEELLILGDGTQQKNYFLVEECINGMAWSFLNIPMTEEKPADIFNLGTTTITKVLDIASIVVEEMGINPVIKIQGAKRAWPGDQPKVNFKVDKMTARGWVTRYSSNESIRHAVRRMLGKESLS